MVRIKTTIDRTGPFFQHDPAKTFRENEDAMMAAVAEAGEREAKIIASPFRVTGAFQEGIRGRDRRLTGAPFTRPTAVVSQTHIYPWKSAGVRQYRGGKLEASRHIFRLTSKRVGSVRALNQAELLKGLQ